MKSSKAFQSLLLAILCLAAGDALAYQVWIDSGCAPSNAAVFVSTWTNTAALADGHGDSTAPCLPTLGTPCQYETSPQAAQWKIIFQQFKSPNSDYGLARSTVTGRDPTLTNELAYSGISNSLTGAFAQAASYQYQIGLIAFYDNALTINGTNVDYNWTTNEVQYMRDWLDTNGHPEVGLEYDARNFGVGVQNWCNNPLVTAVMLEAAPDLWYANVGSRQQLLKWLWITNASTAGGKKPLYFQMPTENSPPAYSQTNNFMSVRRLLVWLGGTFMDYRFLQSSNVIFKPATYNGPTLTFYPETAANGALYTNTLTSLALSLIEQKNLFEGRTLPPTQADADNMTRFNASRSDLVGYWNCDESSGTTLHGQSGGMDVPLISSANFTNGSVAFKNGSVYFSGVNNTVSMFSPELQLVTDPMSGNQIVGLRFASVGVPPGATVTKAYVQFTSSLSLTNGPCLLNLQSEAADSAAPFQVGAGSLTGRTLKVTNIAWSPPGWMVAQESALPERTPELRGALQAVVNRPGWSSSNAMAFYLSGCGNRTANAYDADSATAPLLHLEWTLDGNGDGIADAWQTMYFGSPDASNAAPNMDVDRSGMDNLEKYVAGLNPTNPAAKFVCRVVQTNGQVLVQFDTIQASGPAYQGYTRYYDLQYRTNLMSGAWLGVPGMTNLFGNNSTMSYTSTSPYQAGFFRVSVRLE